MTDGPKAPTRPGSVDGSLAGLAFAALGVVFGDIGTSPLYTLQTVLNVTGGHPSREAILGAMLTHLLVADHHHLGQVM